LDGVICDKAVVSSEVIYEDMTPQDDTDWPKKTFDEVTEIFR
jgi:hypothetical protein